MQKAKKKIKKPKAKTDGGYRLPNRETLRRLLPHGKYGPGNFEGAYNVVSRACTSPPLMEQLQRRLDPDERWTVAQMAEQYARERHKPLAKDARARLTGDEQK